MIQLPFAFMLQAAAMPAAPPPPDAARYERCIALVAKDPEAGAHDAAAWQLAGGGYFARQCLGVALTNQGDYTAAAHAFEDAARAAEIAKDTSAANYWVQAGNAWLLAQEYTPARAAFDAALADPRLAGLQRGEAELDRARALVGAGDVAGGRAGIDRALLLAADDPLTWLLSAQLARRAGDLPRAQKDIGQALNRAADDAAVQLEAGNIAATAGDEAGARAAWTAAARLRPGSPEAESAKAALAQFD